jgi:hypothetical protein
MDSLPGLERRFSHPGAVDVSAISGAEVNDHDVAVIHHDLAVGARDGRIIELKVVGWTPPD